MIRNKNFQMVNSSKGEVMKDFYGNLRNNMIQVMQGALQEIRSFIGYTTIDFSRMLGITRQSLNNLEAGRVALSVSQYISICAILDSVIDKHPQLLGAIEQLLKKEAEEKGILDAGYEPTHTGSFLKRWFLCFPDGSGKASLPSFEGDLDLSIVAENYAIFLDYSFLEACEEDSLSSLNEKMKEFENQYRVAWKMIDKAQNDFMSLDKDVHKTGEKVVKLLQSLQQKHLLKQVGGLMDDEDFQSSYLGNFTKGRSLARIFLLTQDEEFAEKVKELNDLQERGFPIIIGYFKNGEIKQY